MGRKGERREENGQGREREGGRGKEEELVGREDKNTKSN